MKVRFLKDHLENKAKDVEDVDDDRANYFILTGVAEEYRSEKKDAKPAEKEKKSDAGPNRKPAKK